MTRPARHLLVPVVALLVLMTACGDDDATATTQADTTQAATTQAATTQAQSPNTAPFVSTSTTEPPAPVDPNRTVQAGDAISVHYVGTLDDGEQFDSSRDRGRPLSFVVGSGDLISGFDAAVMGMKVGDVKTVRLEASEAYGERVEVQTVPIPLDQLPDGVEVGQVLVSAMGDQFTVLEVGETEATLEFDPNHPLAGEALTFEIELVSFDN